MTGLSTGNAGEAGAGRSGWFVGHFVDDPLRAARDVEVKWAHHPAGQTNGHFAANRTAHTLSVLVRGRFVLLFTNENRTVKVVLEREGDYALWAPGVPHDWVAETDCLIVTVRWPSVPRDQV